MGLGVALSDLRYALKAETYNSLLPAHTVSSTDMYNAILARSQKELWNEYVWPHLKYHIDIPSPAGNRFLAFDPTMPFENIVSIWYFNPPQWYPVRFGFTNADFANWGGEGAQSWPPARWRNVVTVTNGLTVYNGQMEILPVPVQPTTFRFEGQAPLNPLLVDTDTCMIDDTAIVLMAAAELLGSQKSETAQLKQTKANTYIRRLLGKSGANKRRVSVLGQGAPLIMAPTPYLDYVPITSNQ